VRVFDVLLYTVGLDYSISPGSVPCWRSSHRALQLQPPRLDHSVADLSQGHCCVTPYRTASEHDPDDALDSDGEREVPECHTEPMPAGDFGSDVVVAAAEILHEGMTGGEDPRGAVTLQSPHRPQPGLQPPVVSLDRVVRVLLHDVQRRGDQLIEHPG